MGWPYHFVDLDAAGQSSRRELLDRYGAYAQLSAFVPVLLYQLNRLAWWVLSERQRAEPGYASVPRSPGSPISKKYNSSPKGVFSTRWRAVVWWLQSDLVQGWGERGHWIAGGAWAAWLLFLSVHETGVDYLHITKRFGVIAASQFPVHYMLSMKGQHSPLALAFSASHEQLNPWHRISGRIIYSLLILHATWYMNFFIQVGVLKIRMTSFVPLLGVSAFCLLTVLVTSTLASVRRWSYRVFFALHLVIGVALLPILFLHARPLRLYTAESLALFVLDLIARRLDTVQGFATVTPIDSTNLLKITIPIPASKAQRFSAAPGQHVYLSLPRESRPYSSLLSILDILHNPFTVAEATPTTITLVLRTLNGPTTQALKALEKLPKAMPPINIEGPYGSSKNFPNLATSFDRVLLVAGGVGATFIMPIFKQITNSAMEDGLAGAKVEFIWSMRSSADGSWATSLPTPAPTSNLHPNTAASTSTTPSRTPTTATRPESTSPLSGDDRIQIFTTGMRSSGLDPRGADAAGHGSLELQDWNGAEQETLLQAGASDNGDGTGNITETGRPDLRAIVDRTFRHGDHERVAVLVCGPAGMAKELRAHVDTWVTRGRDVWWHDEAFGW